MRLGYWYWTRAGGGNEAGHPQSLDQTQAGPLGDENLGLFLELPFPLEAGMSPPFHFLSSFATAASKSQAELLPCFCDLPSYFVEQKSMW